MPSDSVMADELFNAVLRQRLEGANYPAIALLHGISVSHARHICKRAVKRGLVTREAIGYRPVRKRDPLPEGEYNRQWVERVKRSIVVSEAGCWIWQGNRAINGYGQTNYRGKTIVLHRRMYEIHHNIKLGRWQYACHSCDVKLCCNPEHLWIGTPKDNQVDCILKRRNSEQNVTHCPRGHAYDEKNTTWKVAASGRPARECKECTRERSRRRWANNREELCRRARERRQRAKQEQRT